MDSCDVVIAGGGPAGSACAWVLRRAGFDVVVLDRATFPRDKVCAGWITPQVLADLQIDPAEYRRNGRVFQPITGFRVGTIGAPDDVLTEYDRVVSYGIRRCEFDHYLLQRSCARTALGTSVGSLRRQGVRWIVNDAVEAPMLIGAGGHFCPVAKLLNPRREREDTTRVIAAQEVEFAVSPNDAAVFTTVPTTPELYFCRDLRGYGWCFRKAGFLNVGFGRLDRRSLPAATAEFVAFLVEKGTVPPSIQWRWHGHAYRINDIERHLVDDGVLLVGDAAGIAYAESGEGIRPAIESGLLAATTVIEALGRYTRRDLEPYVARLRTRFGTPSRPRILSRVVPPGISAWLARRLLRTPGFVRHVVLDRWFLRAEDPALIEPRPARSTAA